MKVKTFLTQFFLIYFTEICIENEVYAYDPTLTYVMRIKYLKMLPPLSGNYSIDQYNKREYINGRVKLPGVVDKVDVFFHRCDSEGVNCEYFQMWELTNICDKLKDKNQIWSSIYLAFDPPLICPLDKIDYEIKNATLDLQQVVRWYPNCVDYQWKLLQKFFGNNVYVGSSLMHISILGYRKKPVKLIN